MEVKEPDIKYVVQVGWILEGEIQRCKSLNQEWASPWKSAGKPCIWSQMLNVEAARTLILLVPGQSHNFVVTLSSCNRQAIHYPHLLGSTGVPQPAQRKFWATTTSSLLRTENGYNNINISEVANGTFFNQWTSWCVSSLGTLILSIIIWKKKWDLFSTIF